MLPDMLSQVALRGPLLRPCGCEFLKIIRGRPVHARYLSDCLGQKVFQTDAFIATNALGRRRNHPPLFLHQLEGWIFASLVQTARVKLDDERGALIQPHPACEAQRWRSSGNARIADAHQVARLGQFDGAHFAVGVRDVGAASNDHALGERARNVADVFVGGTDQLDS